MFVAPLVMFALIALFVLPAMIARMHGWGDEDAPSDEEDGSDTIR